MRENGWLIEHERWKVRPLVLTPQKTGELWAKMQDYRTLFSDLTRGKVENFVALVTSADSYWLEVMEGDEQVGVVYWTGMSDLVSAQVHVIFWDRKPIEKAGLCREIARHFFRTFPHHRMEAILPAIYYQTLRLAKKIGFVEEGRKRQSQVMGGKYVDEVVFGMFPDEIRV